MRVEIVGQDIGADDYAVVIEGPRSSIFCAWEARYAEERAVTATLEDVAYSIAVPILA